MFSFITVPSLFMPSDKVLLNASASLNNRLIDRLFPKFQYAMSVVFLVVLCIY